MLWRVWVRQYAGDDYWYDYPPESFSTSEDAEQYARRFTNNEHTKTNIQCVALSAS